MALFELGEQHAGQVLTACDCLSMLGRGIIHQNGLPKQMIGGRSTSGGYQLVCIHRECWFGFS